MGAADIGTACADSAGHAANLGGRPASDYALAGQSGYVAEEFAVGDEVTVAEGGGIRIFARCAEENQNFRRGQGAGAARGGGPYGSARLFLDTTADNVTLDDSNGPEESDYDAAAEPIQLFGDDGTYGEPEIEVTDSGSGVTAIAQDGTVVAFNDYALGNNLAGGDPGDCFVSGRPEVTKFR